jgi:hypothetical protein
MVQLLLLQWPVFVYTAATVRRMALAAWPGFSSEGALWFPDLTLAALVLRPDGSLLLPMGWAGLVLPLGITAMMLTSIRIGFKAAGEHLMSRCGVLHVVLCHHKSQ